MNSATGINDSGLIVGNGLYNGQPRGYILNLNQNPSPQIVLTSATKTDASDIGLNYTISQANVGQPLGFNVYQSDQASIDSSSILLAQTTLLASDTTDLSQGTHSINLPLTTPIAVNPTLPYIVVVANPNNSIVEASGSVNTISTQNIPPYTPDQIRAAYDLPPIEQLPSAWSGSGETIAIVDSDDDPTIFTDSNVFNSTFGLPLFGTAGGPSLTIYGPSGLPAIVNGVPVSPPIPLPPAGSTNESEVEEALDVEWAHAIAPDANIDMVEVFSSSSNIDTNLLNGAKVAGGLPGVSVVSMSFGTIGQGGDYEDPTETSYDSYFSNNGITYIGASGDHGSNLFGYPPASPNVLAVGGTTLTLTQQDNPTSSSSYQETGWSGSGGGLSQYETEPMYQVGYGIQSKGMRAVPDVAFDADSTTGVYVENSYSSPSDSWEEVGGTSLGAPAWAGLIAIVDQQRAAANRPPLTGATQTLPALYSSPSSNFKDIQSGSNGSYSAGSGYDEVTGLGSPIAGNLVPYLAAWQPVSLSSNFSLSGTVGATLDQRITAGGGSGHTKLFITPTWATYPLGVDFSVSNNLLSISGTPTLNGTFTFNVTATDPYGSTDTEAYTLNINAHDVTTTVNVSESGLVYNRATQLFSQTITLTNNSLSDFVGSLDIMVDNLPSGVTLADANGYSSGGNPYVVANLVNGVLVPGQTLTITILFADPSRESFSDELDIDDI